MKALAIALSMSLWLTASCASRPVRLDYRTVDSRAMGRPMQVATYLPLDFRPGEALPLVVFLHGAGDSPRSFDRFGVGAVLDEALRQGRIPRAVIVVPQGDLGMWTNWYDGTHPYEDWVVNDVIADAQARYGTLPCPEGCHLAGASMGGAGALRIALHHPGLFATVSSLSGMVLDRDEAISFTRRSWIKLMVPMGRIFGPMKDREALVSEDLYLRWQSPRDLGGTRLFLTWGDRDKPEIRASNERFTKHLADHGIPCSVEVYQGGHAWKDWKPELLRVLGTQLAPAELTSRRPTDTLRP